MLTLFLTTSHVTKDNITFELWELGIYTFYVFDVQTAYKSRWSHFQSDIHSPLLSVVVLTELLGNISVSLAT